MSTLRRRIAAQDNWQVHALILFSITLFSRIAFRSSYLFDHDSVQFALGMRKYDVYLHQPHPPGYFLYVRAGQLIDLLVHDANASLIWISALASASAVAILYVLGNTTTDRRDGWWAALLALTSPLFWFFGEVALTYSVATFFSSLVALGSWRVLQGKTRWIYPLSVVFGLGIGFRQDLALFLGPLWLYAVTRVRLRLLVSACLLLLLTVGSWFIPMLIATGGAERYFAALWELWQFNNDSGAIWNAALSSRIDTFWTLAGFLSYGVGLGTVFLLLAAFLVVRRGEWRKIDIDRIRFFFVWLAPALSFFILVFIPPYKYSYGLVLLPAFLLLTPAAVRRVSLGFLKLRPGKFFRVAPWYALAFIVISNAVMFCYSPIGFSLNGLREHEAILATIFSGIRKNFPSDGTVILGRQRSTFSGFRHVQYYLPQYRVYLVDQQRNQRGEKWYAFGARDGKTILSKEVEISADTKRIIYLADPYFPDSNKDLKKMDLQQLPLSKSYTLYFKELVPPSSGQQLAQPASQP